MRYTRVQALFDAHRESLGLEYICGSLARTISVTEDRTWPSDLVGHLNLTHPARIQVFGAVEVTWARRQPGDKIAHLFRDVLAASPPALVITDGCDVPGILRALCEEHDIALFSSPASCAGVIDQFRIHLSRHLAEQATLHGVFIDVFGIGVFITGDPGSGKSELALELISRGHGLVADDMVEFSRVAPAVIEGRCPELLQDFIEVRGLGALNIRTIFGETSCRRKMRLRLVVYLQRHQPGDTDPLRIGSEQQTQEILGVQVPRTTLPVVAGRNLSVLLEAAARVAILRLRGIDSTQELIDRQRKIMMEEDNSLSAF